MTRSGGNCVARTCAPRPLRCVRTAVPQWLKEPESREFAFFVVVVCLCAFTTSPSRYALHLLPLYMLTSNGRHVGRAYLDFWCLFREWVKRNMHHWCSTWPPLEEEPKKKQKPKPKPRPKRSASAAGDVEAARPRELFDREHADRLDEICGTIEYAARAGSHLRALTARIALQRDALFNARRAVQTQICAVLQQGCHDFG